MPDPAMPMPKHRIYVDTPRQGSAWPLADHRDHYLRRVLRLRDGDAVIAFDGSGAEWIARFRSGPRRLLEAESALPARRTEGLDVTLVQALARGERMDLALQKSTELGVSRIQPAVSARTEVRLAGDRADKRLRHWRAVVIHAAEQSGRTRVPELAPLVALDAALAAGPPDALRLMLDPEASTRLAELPPPDAGVTVAVGPEGGWTPEELAAGRARGFVGLALGPRILRTETAGPAVLAAMQALWGDLG